MTTYIWTSDPHGTGQPWIDKVLEMQRRYPNAQLVFGGDYIDGRRNSLATLKFVKDATKHGAIALRGNHEQMMLDFIDKNDDNWFNNGAKSTIKSITGRNWSKHMSKTVLCYYRDLLNWLDELPTMLVTDQIVFVHAGLDWTKPDPIGQTAKWDRLWIREPYIYEADNVTWHRNSLDKVIVTGHTPTGTLAGRFSDGQPAINLTINQTKATWPCPVLVIKYAHQRARIFTDGGCHSQLPANTGNVIALNAAGELIDQIN